MTESDGGASPGENASPGGNAPTGGNAPADSGSSPADRDTRGGLSGSRTGATDLRGIGSYLLALSRPRFWLYLAGPVLVGAVYAADAPPDLLAPAPVALFAYFLLPANVLLYGVNDVFDADVDAENPKKADAAAGAVGNAGADAGAVESAAADAGATGKSARAAREVRYTGQFWVPVAVAGSGLLGLGLFALARPAAWPWLAGFFALAVAYSAPPVRFKTTPGLDSLSNGLYVLPGAAAYAAVAGAHPPLAALVGGWCWTMAMHTFSAIPDVEPDRRAGVRTTATVLGERGALGYCLLLWALAALAFGVHDVRAGIGLALYPALAAGVGLTDVDVARTYWWYPAINAVAGAAITIWGLTRIVPPESLV